MTTLPAEQRPSKPRTVSGKLRVALDAIVFEGLEMDQAAKRAKLTTRAVRKALQKPHVLTHMRQQRALLVNEVAGSNVHHLKKLRAKSPNEMAKLGAVREIENVANGGGRAGGGVNVNVAVAVSAGYVLDLREEKL